MTSVRCAPYRLFVMLLLAGAVGLARQAVAVEPDVADVQYGEVAGDGLYMDLYFPTVGSAPYPVVLHVHGGGWFAGDKYPLDNSVLDLLNNGVAIASVQYRLTGNHWDHGDDLTFPAAIHDIKGAVRWLRANAATYNFDPTRIGAYGSSAGGHLASLLGTTGNDAALEGTVGGNLDQSSRVQVVGNYYGPCDLMNENPDFMGLPGHQDQDFYFSTRARLIGWMRPGEGIGDIRANQSNPNEPYPTLVDLVLQASPLTHVTSDDPPFFIGHGTEDLQVPVLQATKLEQALQAVGVDVEKQIIEGVGHDELPPSTDAALVSYLLSKLVADVTPPSAPSLDSATAVNETQIDLSWSGGADVETGIAEFIIYRDSVEIARLAGSQTTFNDSGLDANTSYSYEVAAVNGQFAESGLSNTVSASTLADTQPPAIVSVEGAGITTTLRVSFDEQVDAPSAEVAGNYSITPAMTVSGAALQSDGRTVVLTTSPHTPGGEYSLVVDNVQDTNGNSRGAAPPAVPYTFEHRVRNGLVVLYDFEQGSGELVPDVSGVDDPMDLEIREPADVTWTEHGLQLDATTQVASLFWATKIIDACKATSEMTLETWVTPANTTQDGPARMITLSSVYHKRDFTLGPGQFEWVWLVRSTDTDTNGVPFVEPAINAVSTDLTHVVCTWDAAGESRIYVNGQLESSETIGGDFSTWANGFRFVLGNEPVDDGGFDIDWLGEFHHVAVYNRALSPTEVMINYDAGADPIAPDECAGDINGDDNVINLFDLLALLDNWGTNGPGAAIAPPTDVVDLFDLLDMLDAWGACP